MFIVVFIAMSCFVVLSPTYKVNTLKCSVMRDTVRPPPTGHIRNHRGVKLPDPGLQPHRIAWSCTSCVSFV